MTPVLLTVATAALPVVQVTPVAATPFFVAVTATWSPGSICTLSVLVSRKLDSGGSLRPAGSESQPLAMSASDAARICVVLRANIRLTPRRSSLGIAGSVIVPAGERRRKWNVLWGSVGINPGLAG